MARKVPAAAVNDPDTARFAVWYDVLGIDSDYDYDPVWAKCAELGIAPTFHSASLNQGLRLSPTNFCYSHIGHFAAAGHATAKAIFLGGVTRRFPELRFAFLEGGVGWASQLFGDLIEHWERRSAKALERMHPDKLDRGKSMSLVEKYGYDDIAAALRERGGLLDPEQAYLTGGIEEVDDFSACKITRKEDWVDLYAKPYYFGCEADDWMNATAFGRSNPFGSKFNAIFSSDIGHFGVIDMRHPLPEAYELVEDGHITGDNFRDFTFARCGCGARRTRASSRAPAPPKRPPWCSPRHKPRPSPPWNNPGTAAPPPGGAAVSGDRRGDVPVAVRAGWQRNPSSGTAAVSFAGRLGKNALDRALCVLRDALRLRRLAPQHEVCY